MKKILVLSFFPAFVPPSSGGEARLLNFYQGLSRFHRVTLLTSSHLNAQEERICHGGSFVERRIPKDSHFTAKWDELIRYSSGGDLSAVAIAASGSLPTLLHRAYLEEYGEADIIIHDSPFTIDCDLFLHIDDKVRVYNAYNCETRLYKAIHPEPKSKPLWDIVRDAEVRLLEGCDAVLYCNDDDLNDFGDLAPGARYTAIPAPNGMLPISNAVRDLRKDKIESVVFIGSAHPPNVEAAVQIVENIAPKLPEITFHIIGNCLPAGGYPRNVVRHGFVDDATKTSLICAADLAINPMGAGSGSNVKIFDFLSYGIPVLSSPFGMRGVAARAGEHCLVAPVDGFWETIKAWSARYGELQQIGSNGRKFAAQHYSWDVIAQKVAADLSGIEATSRWRDEYVLVLNDYDSFEDSGGGGVRTRGICAAINDWRPVVFVCFSDDDELTVRWENPQTLVFNVPKTPEHDEELRELNSCFHVAVNDIVAHRHCLSNVILVSIYDVLKRYCRDIMVEHVYMASLPLSYGDRFVYSSHNNEAQIKKQLLRYHPFAAELSRTVEVLERRAVECSSAVIAVSQEDADALIRGVRTAGPLVVVPNGANHPVPPGSRELEVVSESLAEKEAAIFVGSAHMPNVDAVKFIVETLAPSCPTVEFQIIGSVCNAFAINAAKNVRFWGRLTEEMKSAVMQSCNVAINPVTYGGGSNIKLADYFANGLAVITTPFGLRGYSDIVREHVVVSELVGFAETLQKVLRDSANEGSDARSERQRLFHDHFSMLAKAQSVVALLKSRETPKDKVLFVTYRYTYPAHGGAENMLENLIEALDRTNAFQIDVVSPEVSTLNNRGRFAEQYHFDGLAGAKVGLRNVRFARFPLNDVADVSRDLAAAWQAQPLFEKAVYQSLKDRLERSGPAWGWGSPEHDHEGKLFRWGYTSCGLHLHEDARVRIKCYSPCPVVVWLRNERGELIQVKEANLHFHLDFAAPRGGVEISVSAALVREIDARPLAFSVSELSFDGCIFDLDQPLVPETAPISDESRFNVLDKACVEVRVPLDVNLTNIRGPFSPGLEDYLASRIQEYDLVVTHNNIFRPAVIAVETAKKAGVPVISIPHSHLDDDFYHFPDVHRSIVSSDLVLAAPNAACDFYRDKGANVGYLPAGVNTEETFSDDDVAAFRRACSVEQPFVLVLGRKSRAKGYEQVIEAVESLGGDSRIHVVMIGPDDDKLPVHSPCVSCLGSQPRTVVRGALLSCKALVNMSSSESFGIVLLEAWMAGKPVIANNSCAAFHDLAIDDHNALLVSDVRSLRQAIKRLLSDQELCDRLAENGKGRLKEYDWACVGSLFVDSCRKLIDKPGSDTAHTVR